MKKLLCLIFFIGLTLFLLSFKNSYFGTNNAYAGMLPPPPPPPTCGYGSGVYCDPCQIFGNCYTPPPPLPPAGTCNANYCPYYCGNRYCQMFAPQCASSTTCGGTSTNLGYSASCNNLYYYGGYVACPLNPPINPNTFLNCSTSSPVEQFYWTNGTDSYKAETPTFYYCDETYAEAYGVNCTTGSDPSGNGSRAGWYLAISQNSPVILSVTSNPWPWGAGAGTPLTIGHSYRWIVHEYMKDGNGIGHTADTQGPDFTAVGCTQTCSVSWGSLPSPLVAGQSYNIPITTGNASDGWQNISVYTDNDTSRGNVVLTSTGGNTFNLNFNARTAGGHTLKFWNHDNVGYAGGAGPSGTLCTPSQGFTTVTPINGVCAKTHNNCTAGSTGGTAEYTGSYQWWCNGSNGGSNTLCSEAKVNGACAATHYNCSAGNLGSTAEYSGQWQWWCNSSNGGGNTLCTEMKPDIAPIGYHDGSTCSVINGWTCDPNNYNLSLPVHFYDGPGFVTMIGATTANGNRPDVPAAGYCGGNAAVGFSFSTPASVKDYSSHAIYAYPINIDSNGNPTGNNPPLGGTPKTLGPCIYKVKAHVYVDYNGNGNQDAGEPDYAPTNYTPSNDITYGGATGANTTVTTGALGIYEVTNIPAGNNNEALRVNPPTGWTISTAASVTVSGPLALEQTVNFGIHPPAPTCTMTTNQATRYTLPPNNTATLTVNAVKPPTYGGTITYRWFTDLGSVSPATTTDPTKTTTWTAPNPYWDSGTQAKPSAQVCITGGSIEVCGSCGLGINPSQPPITIVPFYSISGFVFVDQNKDTIQNNGESNYTASPPMTVSICPGKFCSSGGTPITATNGVFTTGATPALPAGTYMVSASGLSSGYSFTTPPTLAPTIGKGSCAPSNGTCDANGNVLSLHFGISNSNTWIQTIGGDVYMAGGISNPEPGSSECGGPHMSISQPPTIQMPGIMFTGNGSADFGQGDASLNNWVVGKGNIYPNTITLPAATSYASVKQSVKDAGITSTDLPCFSGDHLTGCLESNNLSSGVYSVNGDLKLTGAGNTYTFPSTGDFTFLIAGKLDIETEIHVPIGATATFIVQRDITVGANIGQTDANYNSSSSNIDGYYSTDGSFIIYGSDPTKASSCPTKDKRLNIAGAVVTDANNDSNGSFQVKRDMCEHDVCPTFSIQARPDFVLNAPSYLQSSTRIWKEIAP